VVEENRGVQNSMSVGQPIPHLQRNQPEPPACDWGQYGQHHTRILSLLKDVKPAGVADINIERGLDIANTGYVF